MKLRIGTRGSRLALAQTGHMARALERLGHETELVVISTVGDRVTDRPFAAIGPPGVFVREIEKALLDGSIDVAVHSYKDLPTASPEGLVVAAVPERRDPSDVLVVDSGCWDAEGDCLPLSDRAVVGTSSSRRRSLLRDLRPELGVEGIRGNVPTRLRKCHEGGYDAVVLAVSGLRRLQDDGLSHIDGMREFLLPPERFVPAPSQGALALQTRDAGEAHDAVAALDLPEVRAAVAAERSVLAALEGGCEAAIGAWCRPVDGGWEMHGAFEREDGLARAHAMGPDLEAVVAEVVGGLRG